MSDSRSAKLYNIAAGQPFLAILAETLIDDKLRHDLFGDYAVEQCHILLPTRRAARQLGEAFIAAAETRGQMALVMPHISTLGDIDEDFLDSSAGDGFAEPEARLHLRAIDPQERFFQLLTPVRKWAEMREQALDEVRLHALAYALGDFLDEANLEEIDLSRLHDLVNEQELADNWQQTLDFLAIITEAWPQHLAENNLQDAVLRRNGLLDAQAADWQANPPDHPIIAAGSTGSIKATARLLKTIAGLPNGAVILPGLDRTANHACWRMIGKDVTHPQNALAHLLNHFDCDRDQVRDWPQASSQPAQSSAAAQRSASLQAALVPAEATSIWAASHRPDHQAETALPDCQMLEAPDQRSEAGAIALAMRQTLETPGKTAALVTRDRHLARRVTAELQRWHIEIDDSAGRPLSKTPAALLLRLALDAARRDFAPVPLLALLKHPMVGFGQKRGAHLAAVRQMEKAILRGPRPTPGLAGLEAALGDAAQKRDKNLPDAEALLSRLREAFSAFRELPDPAPLSAHIDHLAELAEKLLCAEDDNSFFDGAEDRRALAVFFEGLRTHAQKTAADFKLTLADWPEVLDLWLSRHSFRQQRQTTPRLSIWGPLEARLMHADLMILGGLNEGSWPPLPETGPWLSRPMREELGLSLPERQIGQAAHDFVQAASAPQILLTRAVKVDGAPGVAARWLRRLETLYGKLPRATMLLHWWHQLDRPDGVPQPVAPPAPCPPLAARPRQLSVTQIETLLFDPYTIYARKVLNLPEWETVDASVSAAHRGSFLHGLFEQLIKDGNHLHDDIANALLGLAREAESRSAGGAAILQFWQARLEATALWFADYERNRRAQIAESHAEITGRWPLSIDGAPFTLTAKADRIDRLKSGGYAIIDYKTGQPPSHSMIKKHLAVQMTLEAAMLADGAFAENGLPPGPVEALDYIKLSGRMPPGEVISVTPEAELINGAIAMLHKLLAQYQNPDQPYFSHIRQRAQRFTSAYDHLARFAEWASDDNNSDDNRGDRP